MAKKCIEWERSYKEPDGSSGVYRIVATQTGYDLHHFVGSRKRWYDHGGPFMWGQVREVVRYKVAEFGAHFLESKWRCTKRLGDLPKRTQTPIEGLR